jgi:biopolymer transport protein ExbB
MHLSGLNIWQLMLAGGPMMWPILIVSVFGIAIIAERLWFFKQLHIDTVKFTGQLLEKIKRREIKEAVQLCDSARNPVTNVLKAAIVKYDRPRSQIKEAMEDAALYELPKFHKNLPALATLAQVAPLLGFLGTLTGMVRVFGIINSKAGNNMPVAVSDVASGILEALLATIAGLAVAIPAYIAYNYLVARVNSFILEMEQAATELVNFLTE